MSAGSDRPTLEALASAFDITSEQLDELAKRCAASVFRLSELWTANGTPEAIARHALRDIARRHRVLSPAHQGFAEQVNRMRDPAWWRRALRKRFQAVELAQIRCGAVHKQASPYISPKSLRRYEHSQRRMAELLASLEAVNEATGQVLPLDELIEASQANPANRRRAMMARIKGVDAAATAKGHEALFLTITAPSRMHARHDSGRANERHDGTYPRQAQNYLCRVWRKAMRSASHAGLTAYGLRVVEPHHDGCPHWHVLMFTAPEHAEQLIATFRGHALADSPNEPGAAKVRFTAQRIDPAKGSAVGYVAKYVSKSIDGEGLDADDESATPGREAARRVVAWARLWGIRQFQFFGLPAITPTRELYRHDGQGFNSRALTEAHQAARENDYAAWLRTCEVYGLRFRVQYRERRSTRYAGELAHAIHGLRALAADLLAPLSIVTRCETWSIQRRQGAPDGAEPCPLGLDSITAQVIDGTQVFDAAEADAQAIDRARDDDGRRRRRPGAGKPSERPKRSREGPPGARPTPPHTDHVAASAHAQAGARHHESDPCCT